MDTSRLLKPPDEDEISEDAFSSRSASSAVSVRSAFTQCSDAVWSGTPKKGRKKYPGTPPGYLFESPAKKQSKWSAEEDAQIIELWGKGMKWEEISKHLPGRSAISCRLRYQNSLERRSEWDEDRKNKLARLYERFKVEMWSKIASEMSIPWRAAEEMHWQLGEYEMARRAGITSFSLASASLEPPSTKIPRPSHAVPGCRTPSQDTEPISQSPLKGQEHSSLPTKTEPPLFHKAHSEDHRSRHQVTDTRGSKTVLAPGEPVQGVFDNGEYVPVSLEPYYQLDKWREELPGLVDSSMATNAGATLGGVAEPLTFPADSEHLDINDFINLADWPLLGGFPAELDHTACLSNAHLSSQRQVLSAPSYLPTWLESNDRPIWLNPPLLGDHAAVMPGNDPTLKVDILSLDKYAGLSPTNRAGPTGLLNSLDENKDKRKSPGDSHSKVHVVKQTLKRRRRGTKVATKRHPINAVNLLSAWLDQHRKNPYPSAKERAQLAKEAGLTERQVRSWFMNARNRGHLSPLEAWPSGPSEDKGAVDAVIRRAVESPAQIRSYNSEESKFLVQNVEDTDFDFVLYSGQGDYHSPRMTPGPVDSHRGYMETNQGKQEGKERAQEQIDLFQHSKTSSPLFEALLGAPELLSLSPINSSLIPNETSHGGESSRSTIFQCTFCCKPLVEKSWKRHEESTHLPRRTWTCLRTSFRIRSSSNNTQPTKCAFCDVLNPNDSHVALHARIEECQLRPKRDRVFVRKDGLAQHLTMFHGASRLRDDVAAEWESNTRRRDQCWTCGFCGKVLDGWDLRATHIAQHFRNGATMDQWLFEPEIPDMNAVSGRSNDL